MKRFGGIGIKIMMHKTEFEIEVNRVNSLVEQIRDRNKVIADASLTLSKLFEGDLQKLAGATAFGKTLTACKAILCKANQEINELKKLMEECRQAQDRAKRALPDYAMFFSEGRQDTVPGRTFFIANKSAGTKLSPLELPAQRQSVDPMANIGDVQLSHRFQK